MRPLFLISNDDGIHSPGLQCLIDLLKPFGDLLVCVPDGERSGASTSFTTATPLSCTLQSETPELSIYTSNGTPVDCVKLALNLIVKDRKPQMIFSGINHGFNGSIAIHYSGTMGAAMEGCMAGYPSIGISINSHSFDIDFGPSIPLLKKFILQVLQEGLPTATCLNINIPCTSEIKGIKICRQGHGHWEEEFDVCPHRSRKNLYWLTGDFKNLEPKAEDNDLSAMRNGYISVVPQQLDMTDYSMMEKMKQWPL